MDWVSKAKQYGSNAHVTDLKVVVTIEDGEGQSSRVFKVYGPLMTKCLARWGYDTGTYTIQNADSLALFAMARYVQKALGDVYPHLPLAPIPPDSVIDPNPGTFIADGLFTINSAGITTILNES